MSQNPIVSIAERVAAFLDDDGTVWTARDGRDLDQLCNEHGADVSFGRSRWDPDADALSYETTTDLTTKTLVRYHFPDGSAIVASIDAWDFEGDEPFSWPSA